jgi:Asp-tRNA(Asn)/Glu-tRNA(Gln) amidotransferase A subunit family amidase
MAFASSLDVVGCFGTSVHDVAIVLDVIAGHDKCDSTSSLLVSICFCICLHSKMGYLSFVLTVSFGSQSLSMLVSW